MDGLLGKAADRLGLPFENTASLTQAQLYRLSPTLRKLHHEQYGRNCHAFYAWCPGVSHSKVMALVYPTFLRVVITSSNMTDVDTDLNDNHWYIHDLPKLRDRSTSKATDFEMHFLRHLRYLGTPRAFISSIKGIYDYSRVKVHLVTNVPGSHSVPARAQQYGLLRLRRVLRELNLDLGQKMSAGDMRLEVCSACLGQLSIGWVKRFIDCATGRDVIEATKPDADVAGVLKLFYPTTADVMGADNKPQPGAGRISSSVGPWSTTSHPIRGLFHHYHSKDPGHLSHQSLIMAYNPRDTTAAPYYMYVGSANLSQASWGFLKGNKRRAEETCGLKLVGGTNFECGVVVPGHLLEGLLEPGTPTWQDGVVPYVQTAKRYAVRDRPWHGLPTV